MNGDEEVKIIKKDLIEAKEKLLGQSEQLVDLIKFSITGNVKQIQKLLSLASSS